MDRIRIGVLGAGRGLSLAKAAALAPSAELAAVCDADEQRLALAKDIAAKAYDTYEDLLADDSIDAVIVASPMPLHAEHSIAALEAGKHVLSEVTAATSIEQCHQLLDAVRRTGKKYMLAENYCYMRPWTAVLGMVRAGMFGDVYYGESDQLQEFKGGFVHPSEGSNWRTAELALRRGHQYITHDVGPLYQAIGERIQTVTCIGSGQHHLPWVKADDTCIVLGRTTSGKLVRIRLDFFSNRPNNYLYLGLQGTNAGYEAPRGPKDEHKIHVHGVTPRGEWQSLWDFDEYLSDGWKGMPTDAIDDGHDGGASLMIEDFARCIIEDTRLPIDIIDALNMTAPGLMSEVSAERGGEPVEVPEFGLD